MHPHPWLRRVIRVCLFGLVTITAAVLSQTILLTAPQRHRYYAHHVRHDEARESYSPALSFIIVDGNSARPLSEKSRREPLSRLADQDYDAYLLSSASTPARRNSTAKWRSPNTPPSKLHRTRPVPGSNHSRRGRHQGTGHALCQRRAVVIAEAIAGDERDFAGLMTRKARALGMVRTVYRMRPACLTTNR